MTIELNNISSGYSTGLINDNFQAIEEYVNNKLLNREGIATGESNQMELSLDMNSHSIYNLPEPTLDHQAARLQDVKDALAGGSANLIDFTPSKNISSENIQSAIEELIDDLADSSQGGDLVQATTSTGGQTLSAALDSRVIYKDTVSSLEALPTSNIVDGQVANVQGIEFRWDSVASSWKPVGLVSVRAFGVSEDNTPAGNQTALQAALDSGYALTSGTAKDTYTIGGTVTSENKDVILEGSATFIFDSQGDGLVITQDAPYYTKIGFTKFLTSVEQTTGRGVVVSYDSAAVLGNRHLHLIDLSCQLSGTGPETGCWRTALQLTNPNRMDAVQVRITGRRNLSAAGGTEDRQWLAGTVGIKVSGVDGSPTAMDFRWLHIRHVERGIDVSGGFEGLTIANTYVIACLDGIRINATGTDPVEPGLFLQDCHINAVRRAIDVRSMFEVFIHHNEIYRLNTVDGYDFVALYMDTVSEGHINDILVNGDSSNGSPASISAARLINFKRSFISNFRITNCLENIGVEGVGSIDNVFTDIVSNNDEQAVAFTASASEDQNDVSFSGGYMRESENASQVVVTSATTNVVSLGLKSPVIGSRYRVTARFRATKGGTGGQTSFLLYQGAGAGAGSFSGGKSQAINRTPGNHSAGLLWEGDVSGVFEVTAAGGVTITLAGTSPGSDATVEAGDGVIYVERIR